MNGDESLMTYRFPFSSLVHILEIIPKKYILFKTKL